MGRGARNTYFECLMIRSPSTTCKIAINLGLFSANVPVVEAGTISGASQRVW